MKRFTFYEKNGSVIITITIKAVNFEQADNALDAIVKSTNDFVVVDEDGEEI